MARSLPKDPRAGDAFDSVYQIDGADHLIRATLAPHRYLDAAGLWRDIDTTLIHLNRRPGAAPNDDGGGYTETAGPAQIFFPDSLGASSPVTFTLPMGSLAVTPLGITDGVPASEELNSIRYADAAPGLDLVYTPLADGYEEAVTLITPPQADRFSWDIQATGLTLQLTEGGEITVTSDAGDLVATLPSTFVYDSSSDEYGDPATTNFPFELVDLGGGLYQVSVLYDQGWLQDPARVYPVVVDPTTQSYFPPSDDTFESTTSGSDKEGHYENIQGGGGDGAFAYLNFPLTCCKHQNIVVYSSTLALANMPLPGTTSGYIDVKRLIDASNKDMWHEWDVSNPPPYGLTHNNKSSYDTAPDNTVWDSQNQIDQGWEYWTGLGDLLEHFLNQGWSGYYANRGIRLEARGNDWHVWCSKEATGATQYCDSGTTEPQLYIYYNNIPDAPTAAAPLGNESSWPTVSVASPTLSVTAKPTDPDNDKTRVIFQVSKSATDWTKPNLLWSGDPIDGTSDVVPAGILSDGQSYYWRAQSVDWCTDVDSICSNVDATGMTHDWHTTADSPNQAQKFAVSLPHYGSDPKWAMWSQGLGNGMSLQVNQATGNVYLGYPLDSLETPVGALALELSYNSQLSTDQGLGTGWNIAAGPLSDSRLLPTKLTKLAKSQGDGIQITFGDSSVRHYSLLSDDVYQGEGNDGGTVYKNTSDPTTKWSYQTDSGSVFTFDTNGNPLTATPASNSWDKPGFTYTFASDIDGFHLRTITDPLGRAITFSWTPGTTQYPYSRLNSISSWVDTVDTQDPPGTKQTWTLAYDTGAPSKLISVKNAVAETVKLTYDPTSPFPLGSIQDGELVATTSPDKASIGYTFGSVLRASSVKLPPPAIGGQAFPSRFCYGPTLVGSVVTQTSVSDPRGTKYWPDPNVACSDPQTLPLNDDTVWTDFDTAARPIRIAGPYDQNAVKPITRMVWDNNGNLRCSRSPAANATPLPDGEKCILVDGNYDVLGDALNTDYVYDDTAPFRLRTKTEPAPDTGQPTNRAVTSYSYDAGMTGLVQQEFTNKYLSGTPQVQRIATNMDFTNTWDNGQTDWYPSELLPYKDPNNPNFSMRFTGTITVSQTKTYSFKVSSDDGVRLVVGGVQILECWKDHGWPNCGGTGVQRWIHADKPTPIVLEYYEKAGTAKLRLDWDQGTGNYQVIPSTMLSPNLGLVTSIADPTGTTSWTYSTDSAKLKNLPDSKSKTDRVSGQVRTTNYTYEAYGRPLTESVVLGQRSLTTRYTYTDDPGQGGSCVTKLERPSQTNDTGAAVTEYTCDAAGHALHEKRTIRAAANQAIQYRDVDTAYDDAGRKVSVSVPYRDGDPVGPKTLYAYDHAGRLKQVTDPMTYPTTYVYDQDGRMTERDDPSPDGVGAGPVTKYSYDEVGNRTKVTDPRNHDWLTSYDALNRVIQTTTPGGTDANPQPWDSTWNYVLSARTVTQQTQGGPNGSGGNVVITQVTTNDLLGRPTSGQTGTLTATTSGYDQVGNLTSLTKDGVTTLNTYDDFGEVTQTTCQGCGAPNGDINTYLGWDQAGRQTSFVDGRGSGPTDVHHTVTYGYDDAGRLVSSQLPDGLGTTQILYDDAGERVQAIDGEARNRYWTYDYRGRQVTSTDGKANTSSYTYDDDNRLTLIDLSQVTNPAPIGFNQKFEYDHLGRRTRRYGQTVPGNQVVDDESFGYDLAGNLTTTSNATASATLSYDQGNRLITVTEAGATSQFTYVKSQVSSKVDVAGTTSYVYRANDGLLDSVTSPFGAPSSFAYDPKGRMTTRTDPDGLYTTRGYDPADRLSSGQVCRTSDQCATPLATFSVGYDNAANVTSRNEHVVGYNSADDGTWTYHYDNANRMMDSKGPTASQPTTYGYDLAGNRTTVASPQGSVTTHYDAAGYLMDATDGTTYAVDGLGRLTGTTKQSSTTTYGYDTWSRIKNRTSGGTTISYGLDALDRTLTRTKNGTLTSYVYSGTTENPAKITIGTTSTFYAYDPGGPLAQKSGTALRYFVSDLHSDVVGLSDGSTGNLVGTSSFGPWGQPRTATGEQALLGFQSDLTDWDSGLVDMLTRNYDPNTGRFQTQDSLFGDPTDPNSMNQFTYGQNAPVSYTDPTGMKVEGEGGGGCGTCQDDPNETAKHGRGSTYTPQPWAPPNGPVVSVWDTTYRAVRDHFVPTAPKPPTPGVTPPRAVRLEPGTTPGGQYGECKLDFGGCSRWSRAAAWFMLRGLAWHGEDIPEAPTGSVTQWGVSGCLIVCVSFGSTGWSLGVFNFGPGKTNFSKGLGFQLYVTRGQPQRDSAEVTACYWVCAGGNPIEGRGGGVFWGIGTPGVFVGHNLSIPGENK